MEVTVAIGKNESISFEINYYSIGIKVTENGQVIERAISKEDFMVICEIAKMREGDKD